MDGGTLPRGTVTFLFSDIEESSGLVRRVGDAAFAEIRSHHRCLLREAFRAHGGSEVDTSGDGFFVAFESARSAVAAAVDGQRALASFDWPDGADVHVRMGLHTAEPHLADDGYVGIGVHRAARICDAARGDQIVVSSTTAGIIDDAELPGVDLADLGEHRLKGLPREQRLYQVLASGLRSSTGPPRTPDAEARQPGIGTFVLTDLSQWRRVLSLLGDEASAALAGEYHATVGAIVDAHDGAVFERAGDHVLAVFRNAADAVRSATAVREALLDFAWPPECDVRVTAVVHSGRWSGDPDQPAAGTTIARLYRLNRIVQSDQVLVSETTAALLGGDRDAPALRRLGERAIDDFDEPVRIYELAARTPAEEPNGPVARPGRS